MIAAAANAPKVAATAMDDLLARAKARALARSAQSRGRVSDADDTDDPALPS